MQDNGTARDEEGDGKKVRKNLQGEEKRERQYGDLGDE